MYTRCPFCHTYFKVQIDHIRQANGDVRCGRCYKVFSSLGNVFEQLPAQVPRNARNKTFRNPVRRPQPPNIPMSQASQAQHASQAQPSPQAPRVAPAPMQNLPRVQIKPKPKPRPPPTSAVEKPKMAEKDMLLGMTGNHSNAFDDTTASGEMALRPETLHDFVTTREHHSLSTEKMIKWSMAVILVLFLVVLQVSYVYRENLAKHSDIRPWIEYLCNVTGCELPLQTNVDLITLTHRDISSHPRVKSALMISAILINQADFTQPYPVMRISLSDTGGNIVASRDFKPSDYLDANINLRKGMPSQQPIQITLEIADPGKKAINFAFDFYHPKKK